MELPHHPSEVRRIEALVRPLWTAEKVIQAFGPPDCELTSGEAMAIHHTNSRAPEDQLNRVLVYRTLSTIAVVHFAVSAAGKILSFSYFGKDGSQDANGT
jgi:hypothetical protein